MQGSNDSLSKATEPFGLSYNISNIKNYLDISYTVKKWRISVMSMDLQ